MHWHSKCCWPGHQYQPVVWAATAVPATGELPAAVPAAVPAVAGTLLQRGAPVQEGAPAPVSEMCGEICSDSAARAARLAMRLKRFSALCR